MTSFDSFCEWEDCLQSVMVEDSLQLDVAVLHINIRSITKNWDQLCAHLNERKIAVDVIVLTEVNIDAQRQFSFSLNGYSRAVLCRENRKGGGIFVFVKENWLLGSTELNFEYAEALLISISKKNVTYTICAIYRPPNMNVNLFLVEMKQMLNRQMNEKNLIIIGDINIDVMQESKIAVMDYLNLLSEFGLSVVIGDYTREEYLRDQITRSCIDHIITRRTEQRHQSGVIRLKLADHYFIAIAIYSKAVSKNVDHFTLKKILDDKKVDAYISETNWNTFLSLDHVSLYIRVTEIFRDIYERSSRCVKLKQRQLNNRWITTEIMELCYLKDKAWQRCRKEPQDTLKRQEFRTLRNLVTAKIRLAKSKYLLSQFSQHKKNSKKTWKMANELMGRIKQASVDDTIRKNFPKENTRELCNKFNDTFIQAAEALMEKGGDDGTRTEEYKPLRACASTAYLPTITEAELWNIIRGMKPFKPPGFDNIRLRDLLCHYSRLKHVLLKILNGIFETGNIPKEMKVSIVRPIYKHGKKGELGNYRPIAILSVLSHVVEKHIASVMQSFCEKYNLNNPAQFGFTKNRNSILLLEEFSDLVNACIENNEAILVLFLDLSKAFDTVNHKLMLQKLSSLGFRGQFLKFFTSYFSQRFQCVKLHGEYSELKEIQCGVPQGSTLGPILFNIYVTDLSLLPLKSNVFQYADDTALALKITDSSCGTDTFQNDIHKVMDWFKQNSIFVNLQKTKLACFRNPHKAVCLDRPVYLHTSQCSSSKCRPLELEPEVKYLGLFFDQHFTWNKHVLFVCKKLRGVAAMIHNLRGKAPLKLRQTIYKSLAEGILNYGITLYGSCSDHKQQCINRVINRIANSIAYGTKLQDAKIEDKYSYLGILQVHQLFRYEVLTRYYFCKKFKVPVRKSRTLRKTERFVKPRVFTNYGKKMRKHYVPEFFNALRNDLYNLKTRRKMFKKIREYCVSGNSYG